MRLGLGESTRGFEKVLLELRREPDKNINRKGLVIIIVISPSTISE
jgi:hypothetical protein